MVNGHYVATVYYGNEVVDEEVEFEIDNTSLATISWQEDNECELEANKDFKVGKVTLKATLVEDEEVYAEKEISVTRM